VAGGHTWQSVSLGQLHSCGLTSTGAAYCWGAGSGGALGQGANLTTDRLIPWPVAGGHVWAGVDAGVDHGCGVTTTGRAFCWGPTHAGKTGSGAPGSVHYAPAEVTTPP
jgi:hypothetical protein